MPDDGHDKQQKKAYQKEKDKVAQSLKPGEGSEADLEQKKNKPPEQKSED